MKKILLVLTIAFLLSGLTIPAMAASNSTADGNADIKVDIVAPNNINSVPIHDDVIKIRVTNQGKKVFKNLAAYLTVIDVGRSQTYPVDEFGENAYQTRKISALSPGQSVEISVPVHIMYVGEFRFAASVINYDTGAVFAGNALNVTMTAVSNLNKPLVMGVASCVPFLFLGIAIILTKKRGKKRK